MEKGRSNFTISFNCDKSLIEQLINDYINANYFKQEEKNNEKYYKAGDAFTGYRYLNYTVNNDTLTIEAWLKNAFGDIKVEQDKSINLLVSSYRNSLNTLFQEIDKLNKNAEYVNSSNEVNNFNNEKTTTFTETFNNETIKKQETSAKIAFALSILGLLGAFAGIAYGLVVYIMIFYFASQGLKTKENGKAKLAICITIASILILIITIARAS